MVYVDGLSDKEGTGSGWGALCAAANKANLVITEIMPTPPYNENLQVCSTADSTL